jgi:hypothetical protein
VQRKSAAKYGSSDVNVGCHSSFPCLREAVDSSCAHAKRKRFLHVCVCKTVDFYIRAHTCVCVCVSQILSSGSLSALRRRGDESLGVMFCLDTTWQKGACFGVTWRREQTFGCDAIDETNVCTRRGEDEIKVWTRRREEETNVWCGTVKRELMSWKRRSHTQFGYMPRQMREWRGSKYC